MKNLKTFDQLFEDKSVSEKWKSETDTPKSEKGKYKEWTLEDLRAERTKLKDKKSKTADDSSKLREINFAIRAKTGWGKVE